MKAYCIFDDFPAENVAQLERAGIDVEVLEHGKERPDPARMKTILESHDIVIIGTSQKIGAEMWEHISAPRIIGTASVGIDHIKVPAGKTATILNTPTANAQSVAEYIVGCALMCRKRLVEGNGLYREGRNNKALSRKPEDIHGAVVGLIGAGHIAEKVMEMLKPFGVSFLCHTKNPAKHRNMTEIYGARFVALDELARNSDIIAVAVPNDRSTHDLVSADIVDQLKDDCIFISIARAEVTDIAALADKARRNRNFYLCLDLDVSPEYIGINDRDNIIITPHIGGGTVETRKRMFAEVTDRIIMAVQSQKQEREYRGN